MPARLRLLSSLAASLALAASLRAQPTPPPAATIPTTQLTIVGDNCVARPDVKAVWGFACLVKAGGHTILFDTGAEPTVLGDNLAALRIDPAGIEAVVISHYHGDHTFGAPGLGRRHGLRAYVPESPTHHPEEAAALGSAGLEPETVSGPTTLFEGITITQPLPFTESDTPELAAEQCLTLDTPEGLVVIVGCSHPGIVAQLEAVKQQSDRPLHFVIGGLHLFDRPEAEVRRIATAMRSLGVQNVAATHCTGEAAAAVFRAVFGGHYISAGVGAVIELPLPTTTP